MGELAARDSTQTFYLMQKRSTDPFRCNTQIKYYRKKKVNLTASLNTDIFGPTGD